MKRSRFIKSETWLFQKGLAQALADWFQKQGRMLPWRKHYVPYQVWISELMLQQTQVKTMLPYYKRFLKKFPTLEVLAKSSVSEVLHLWSGLGYYRRATFLWKGAQWIYYEKKNQFPETKQQWLQVPGVGPYSAGAICSIAFERPEPILDGNIERVFARYFGVLKPWAEKKVLWDLSANLLNQAWGQKISPRIWNQAWMELGALVCVSAEPDCLHCPLKKGCVSKLRHQVATFPMPKPRKKVVFLKEDVFICRDLKGRLLFEKPEKVLWRKGLWDFLKTIPQKNKFHLLEKKTLTYRVTTYRVQRTCWIYQLQEDKCSPFKNRKKKNKKTTEKTWLFPKQALQTLALGSPASQALKWFLEK